MHFTSRWVCSASAVEALVARHTAVERICAPRSTSLLGPSTSLRCARPLSKRYFAVNGRRTISNHAAQAAVSDDFVPFVQVAQYQEHVGRSGEQLSWPATKSGTLHDQSAHQPELDIDEEQLSRFLEEGLQKQGTGVDNDHTDIGVNVTHRPGPASMKLNYATPQSSGHVPRTSSPQFQERDDSNSVARDDSSSPHPAGSRVQSRLARKQRRQLARGQKSRPTITENVETMTAPNQSDADLRQRLNDLDRERAQVEALLDNVQDDETLVKASRTQEEPVDEIEVMLREAHVGESMEHIPKSSRFPRAAKRTPASDKGPRAKLSKAGTGPRAKHSQAEARPQAETEQPERVREPWMVAKKALKEKFDGQAWSPRKRISPDAIAGVRSLHEKDPTMYSTARLADYFQISPEAIRRILKSKWQPNEDQADSRRARWEKRGEKKWSAMSEQGIRPPRKWRERGVGKPQDEDGIPTWRRNVGGEKWIEHRPPEALFASAASHLSCKRESIATKIF